MRRGREPLLPLKAGGFGRCASRADDELRWFRSCLRCMVMDSSGRGCHAFMSWILFFILTLAVPAASHFLLSFHPQRRPYDAAVQISLSAASASSFLCLSAVSRRYGLRRLLFLDKLRCESELVRAGYTAELAGSFRLLWCIVAPCFAAETAYKLWWYLSGGARIPFLGGSVAGDAAACALELSSWLYRVASFFLTCVLFRLMCHLQILRLQDFAGVFEEHAEVEPVLRAHLDIRRQLKFVSHRFRGFIIACLLLVTASQFASVLLTTRKESSDNLFNTGELALCSIVLVAGLIILLRSAARITHQAQALTAHAAKWHACATIESFEITSEVPPIATSATSNHEGESSDEETGEDDVLENTKIMQPNANTISFQKRQALVTYLENNRAGITVFGFTLDRAWLHTIFMLAWTLFLWLLGKTIGF